MARTLITHATIISMDPKIGDVENGDILIDGEQIVEVGHNLAAEGATVIDGRKRIVIPGMVNAHIHTWEFALRGIGGNWVGKRDYHANMHQGMATRYNARDVYLANLIGSLNQIHHGTTTIMDWCHIVKDAEMTDAAIDGLAETGIRAVFARGTAKPPVTADATPYYKIPYPRDEIHRLRTGRFASDAGLISLAMAILGPDWGEYDVAVHDIRLAREYGLINSAHTYGRKGKRVVEDGYPRLAAAGLLGPDHNIAHGNCFAEDELKIVLDAGCTITATCLTEMLNYEQPAMIGRMAKFGAMPSIGSDCDPYFNSSMLWVTRHAFQHQRELDNRSLYALGQYPANQHSTQTRDALYWATMGGAQALQLNHRIGSITPGKQADLALFDTSGMNLFATTPGGDPAHAIVLHAEAADVDSVMIAGRFVKRDGKLVFPESRLAALRDDLLASRERIMHEAGYRYSRVEKGPIPERFV